MCCCILSTKQHLRFSNQKVSWYTGWKFLLSFSDSDYKTHVKLKRITTILYDTNDVRLSYCGSIVAILPLETSKYQMFSHIKIAFFLFQTVLRYHQWSEWLWTWYLQSSETFDLSLQSGAYDEFRKWQSTSLIADFFIEMLWKIRKTER